MQKTLSIALALLLAMQLIPSASGADDVAGKIAAMPPGARIELRLKSQQTMRGTVGAVSDADFTLVDAAAGQRKISFGDVSSVRQVGGKSHTKRNVLIGVGIGVAALGITAGLIARCAPFGCGKHNF